MNNRFYLVSRPRLIADAIELGDQALAIDLLASTPRMFFVSVLAEARRVILSDAAAFKALTRTAEFTSGQGSDAPPSDG